MHSIRIQRGNVSMKTFEALKKATGDARLEAEALDDGSILITVSEDDDATVRLVEKMVRDRQTLAKEALFDSIEAIYGANIASTLCTSGKFAQCFLSPDPISVEQMVQLFETADRLAGKSGRTEPARETSKEVSAPELRLIRNEKLN